MIGTAGMLAQELASPANILGRTSLAWLLRIYKRAGWGGGGLDIVGSENKARPGDFVARVLSRGLKRALVSIDLCAIFINIQG